KGGVQRWQNLPLQVLFEINKQVAAGDQVHPREGGITQKILSGEDDHLAEELGDAITTILLDKEPAQPFRREVVHEVFCIRAGAGFIEHRLADVASKKRAMGVRYVYLVEQDPPGDAAVNGIGFVEGEIDPGMIAQQKQNFLKTILSCPLVRRLLTFLPLPF